MVGFLFLDVQSVGLVVVMVLSSVSLFVPFLLSFLGLWLWLSNNCESVVFKLFDLVPLPGSHWLFSFQ
jgi:hypothetical protein